MSDFKGVWIPAEVWQIEDLLLIEKVFLCQIQSLCNDDGCFASNSYFANFFGVSNSRCTQIIKKLEEQKYISVELERKGKMVSKRVVTTLNKCSELFKHGSKYIKEGSELVKQGSKQIKEGCLIDSEYNNTEVNNTFNNKEEESKKENTLSLEIESLKSDFKKLAADNKDLQTELKKEKEKSSAKKESSVLPKNGITQIDEGLTYPKNFTEELKQAFKDFIQMRKDIRKPFKLLKSKQTKLDSLGKDIANFGEENVLGAILRSTENEYQGIFVKDFADKHKKSNNGKQTNNNKQPIDDGLSYAERAMRERFGSDLLTDQYQNGSSDDNYQGVEQEF